MTDEGSLVLRMTSGGGCDGGLVILGCPRVAGEILSSVGFATLLRMTGEGSLVMGSCQIASSSAYKRTPRNDKRLLGVSGDGKTIKFYLIIGRINASFFTANRDLLFNCTHTNTRQQQSAVS